MSEKMQQAKAKIETVVDTVKGKVEKVKEVADKIGNKTKQGAQKVAQGAEKVAKVTDKLLALIRKNHPEWYLNYPEVEMVGLNYGYRKSDLVPGTFGQATSLSPTLVSRMTLALTVPSLTDYTEGTGWRTGINRQYTDIRTMNNGRVNYTPQDLERYNLSVRSMVAVFAHTTRIYRALMTWEASNSAIPTALFTAMGIDFRDFANHAADLEARIGIMAQSLKYMTPLKNDLLKRTLWLFSNVFKDSDISKASYLLYTFDQSNDYGVPFWGADKDNKGAYIEVEPTIYTFANYTVGAGMTYETYLNEIDRLVERFQNDDTFNIIAGDILRCYGENVAYDYPRHWSECANTRLEFIYDEYQLTQWQNARLCSNGTFKLGVANQLRKEYFENADGYISARYTVDFNRGDSTFGIWQDALVNTYKDATPIGESLSMTRLAPTLAYRYFEETENTSDMIVTSCGTEIPVIVTNFVNVQDAQYLGGLDIFGYMYLEWEGNETPALLITEILDLMQDLAAATQIDYMPRISFGTYNSITKTMSGIGEEFWDYANYAIVPAFTMRTLADYCSMSLLKMDAKIATSKGMSIVQ